MSRFTFNRAPYFDDYQAGKNFMKVLFRPGRPVQTRELNTLQSIFQNQIESFANHIFKNGSRVSLCSASYLQYQYVRLEDLDVVNGSGLDVNVNFLQSDFELRGLSSGIKAKIVLSVGKEINDPPTLYIVYQEIAIDAETLTFIPGEIVDVYDKDGIKIYSVKVRCPGCPGGNDDDTIPVTGTGTLFSIGAGIFYFEGQFIENSMRQTTIVSKYGEKTDYKIGFDFVQEIISSDNDLSLLDNALGYPNSTAPGADRYKAHLVLTKRNLSVDDGDDFILLATVERGFYRYLKSDSEYSDIMDMIAKRTYETNGDFTVIPYKVRFIEDKAQDIFDDMGYSVDGDDDYYRTVISGGIGYIHGYRFENLGEQFIKSFKARDVQQHPSYIKRFEERTSINLIPLNEYSAYPNNAGISAVMDETLIKMYDGPFDELNAFTGNLVGSFRIYDVNRVGGIIHDDDIDNPNPAVFKYYIYDLNIVPGQQLSNARSFVDENGVRGFKAIPQTEDVILFNPGQTELLWKIEKQNIKSLRSISDSGPNPPGSISISLRKKLIGILNSSGSVTFTSSTNEYFEPYDYQRTVAVIIDTDQGAGIARTIDIAGKTTVTTTQFVVNLGTDVDVGLEDPISTPGLTICVLHSVFRVNAQEYSKTVNQTQVANLIPSNYSVDKKVSLGLVDAFELVYVLAYSASTPNITTDITHEFILRPNVSDIFYDTSYLEFTGVIPAEANIRWKYLVKYYEHNISNNLGYFNVDSYRHPIDNEDISYKNYPVYTANSKIDYPLFESFDFRPRRNEGNISGSVVPVMGSTAVFDISYYLKRIDLLSINKNGKLYLKSGNPSDTPVPPKVDEDAMALYEIHLKPYTFTLNDISVKYIENKRYTMRDIGKIETRVKNVEYYVALNLLEKATRDMEIKDVNGLNRFKNGFIVDNFQDFQAGDLLSSDFRAAIDRRAKELRPSFTPRNKTLVPVKNECDCKFIGNVAIIDYESVVIDEQPFATKHISINPLLIFNNKGQMALVPNMDVWSDTTRLPDLTVNVDTGVDEIRRIADAAGILGTTWESWADLNITTQTSSRSDTRDIDAWGGTSTTVSTTVNTTRDQGREGTHRTIESRVESHDFGDRVTDVSINPWMRSTNITFIATKMLANTKLYAFFDGKPVSSMTHMMNSTPGQQLITDSSGQIVGIFHCPAGMFHTGDRQLFLTTDPNKTDDPDMNFSTAVATFFSGGLNLERQRTTMNVITPVLVEEERSENRTVREVDVSTQTTTIPGTPPPPPPPEEPPPGPPGPPANWDPVAQGFKLERDYFITGIDLYFQTINTDSNDEIWVEIRPMVNGYPSSDPGITVKRYKTQDISSFISENSTVPFRVTFDFPVFIPGNTQYCFVIGGYSPSTRIWIARLGQNIIDQPNKILEEQPSLESSFRSQNSTTWNAEQYEDIKYRLYAAKFKKDVMGIRFHHKNERFELSRDPLEAQSDSARVRVYIEDHGLLPGDKTTISLSEKLWYWIDVTNGSIRVGMPIRTGNSSFTGIVLDYKEEGGKSYIQIGNKKGSWNIGQDFICESMDYTIQNNFLIESTGYKGGIFGVNGTTRFNSVTGIFRSSSEGPLTLNGFTFANLSKQHTVLETDSLDTFIIQIPGEVGNLSGRFGGESSSISINEKFEVFNVSGSYLTYNSTDIWSYDGYVHNPPNGLLTDGEPITNKIFIVDNDNYLDIPHKINCQDNAATPDRLVTITAQFRAPDEWTSPIVNTDSFSITTVSNRVEWVTKNQINVIPNSSGRFKDESSPMNGTENYKYVTKTATLKNPASDLIIIFDVYKDIVADFEVWIKLQEPYDFSDIDQKRWMKISNLRNDFHSSDLIDRIEYEITGSEMKLDVYSADEVFTTHDWDTSGVGFSRYKVKLVGKSKNPALPPLFQSLRCIAIT